MISQTQQYCLNNVGVCLLVLCALVCACVFKGNFCMIGDDLVNSYHLLLCCLDLVFGNALLCTNRKDLINPLFQGVCVCVFVLVGYFMGL